MPQNSEYRAYLQMMEMVEANRAEARNPATGRDSSATPSARPARRSTHRRPTAPTPQIEMAPSLKASLARWQARRDAAKRPQTPQATPGMGGRR